jgi:hypothetical protein
VPRQQSEHDVPPEQRRAIFRALVEAQDRGLNVLASRVEVARRFSVTRKQIEAIEQEGLTHEWPPL